MTKLTRVLGGMGVSLSMACSSSPNGGPAILADAGGGPPVDAGCVPGQRRTAAGCVACEAGTFTSETNAESCHELTQCPPGTYVAAPGSNVADRQCAPCPDGTYSSVTNQAACTAYGACPAGTVETTPATPTTTPVCEPCPTGTFCAGDSAPMEPCPEGTWDDDASSGTACVPWLTCEPGQFVSAPGSATENRSCGDCVAGYTDEENAATCSPWKVCTATEYESAPPSATADRTCAPVFTQTATSVDQGNTKRSGESFGYRFDYGCGSSTGTCDDVEIVDLLPAGVEVVSTTPAAGSGHVSTVTVTPNYTGTGRTRVRFALVDLPTGASGSVHIEARFPNGTTPNGTVATNVGEATNLGADPGPLTSPAVHVTAVAEPLVTLEPELTSSPANLDMSEEYRLRVSLGSGPGSLRLVAMGPITLTLPSGTVFNGATPAAECQPGCIGTTPATVSWTSPCSTPMNPGSTCNIRASVTFPSATFASGTDVTSSFTAVGTPLGLAPRTLGPATITHAVTTFVPSPDASFEKLLVTPPPAIDQALSYELTIGNTGNVPLDDLVVIDTVHEAVSVTSVTTGRYTNLGDFAVGQGVRVSYEKNTDLGKFTYWGSSPNTSTNTTLTAPPDGLAPGEYIRRIRWELGHALPGMTALTRPTISGKIVNPDNEGFPTFTGREISSCADLSAVYTAGPTNVGRNDCESFVVSAEP